MTLREWHAPVLVGALVRVLAWGAGLWGRGWIQTDTSQYWALASDGLAAYAAVDGPLFSFALMRPPGYPAILAILRLISDRTEVVALLHVGFGVAVVALIYSIGRTLGSLAVASVASWWVALSPLHVVDSSVLLTEVSFSVFLLVAVLLMTPLVDGMVDKHRWLGAGLALGLATLIRPISFYLPVIVSCAALASRMRGRLAISTLMFLIGFSMPVGAWMIRNYCVTGVATISTIQGINMAYYRAAGALAAESSMSVDDARAVISARVAAETDAYQNPAELSRIQSRVGVRTILDHPAGYGYTAARGLGYTLLGPGRSHLRERFRASPFEFLTAPLVAISASSAALMLVAALIGVWVWCRSRRWRELSLIGLPLLYLLLVGAGHEGWARFRVPLEPLMALLAGVGATKVFAIFRYDAEN